MLLISPWHNELFLLFFIFFNDDSPGFFTLIHLVETPFLFYNAICRDTCCIPTHLSGGSGAAATGWLQIQHHRREPGA